MGMSCGLLGFLEFTVFADYSVKKHVISSITSSFFQDALSMRASWKGEIRRWKPARTLVFPGYICDACFGYFNLYLKLCLLAMKSKFLFNLYLIEK